jgi:hypothetical protein
VNEKAPPAVLLNPHVTAEIVNSAPAEKTTCPLCGSEKYSAVAWGDLPGPALQQLVSHCDTRAQACLSQTSKAIYWVVKSNLAVARREAIAETKAQLMQRIQETTNPHGGSFEFGGTGTSDIYSRFAPKLDSAFLQIVSTMVDFILLRFHKE